MAYDNKVLIERDTRTGGHNPAAKLYGFARADRDGKHKRSALDARTNKDARKFAQRREDAHRASKRGMTHAERRRERMAEAMRRTAA